MANSIDDRKIYDTERLSRKQKEAKDFAWYKAKIDSFEVEALYNNAGYGGISEKKRMQVNYDMFNNIIDLKDFEYVCKPFGANSGELPATMVNRDITSYRIKSLIGMEMRRAFGYKVLAVNPEVTTRKEEAEASQIRDFVIDSIMRPIQQSIEMKYQQESQGRELTPQEKQQIEQQMQEEIKSKTPPEIRKYMKRDHQDPSEVQGQQILNYLSKEQDLRRKFNNNWKHALLSAYEIYYVGVSNGKPVCKVVNPIRFNFDRSPEIDFIEDSAWAIAEFRMAPFEVVQMFDLDDHEIDDIFKNHEHYVTQSAQNSFFTGNQDYIYSEDVNTIRVIHVQWKGLRRIGWLDYIDADGVLQTKMMVDEDYTLNRAIGDVSISWEWIPETYEGYKIGTNIYKKMQPVEGQFKDMDNIYDNNKLSYYGVVYDDLNSQPTAPMDRMKPFQYFYNIIMYRIELLTASDKGKKILMNINAVPESAGIDVKKWQYFFESSPFMWYSTDEEGMNMQDANTIAKTLDMSLVSDINKYIEMAEYLEQKCGKAVGVTDPVLGQTAVSERVSNNQQNLLQTSHILEPYFDLHNTVKKNVLQGLLNVAKVAYVNSGLKSISYVLDDMSVEILNLDLNLLANTTLGLFVEDSSAGEETKQTIQTLAHAAMQNQKIELSDVLKVVKQSSIQEAEESLLIAEDLRIEREQAIAEQDRTFKAQEAEKARNHEKETWEHEKDIIVLKETERRKTEIQKQAILSVGFNENKDTDNDGQLDAFEIAQHGMNAKIEMSKEARENRALDHQIENDKEKNAIERKKIAQGNTKK